MTAHFEVVRTDVVQDFDQPWHARLVSNDHIMLSSETYTRKAGAERAIVAAARAINPAIAGLRWNVEGREKVFVDVDSNVVPVRTVLYVDERSDS